MECQQARAHLSAVLDDEAERDDVVDDHVAGCRACQVHRARLAEMHAAVRLAPAMPVPDRTPDILAAIHADQPAPRTRRDRVRELATVLGMTGLAQLVVAVPALLASSAVHDARELGAWQLALGAAFLVTAWQPSRAAGLLPVVAVAAAIGMVLVVGDVVGGATTWAAEVGHLLELVGLTLVALIARHVRPIPSRAVEVA